MGRFPRDTAVLSSAPTTRGNSRPVPRARLGDRGTAYESPSAHRDNTEKYTEHRPRFGHGFCDTAPGAFENRTSPALRRANDRRPHSRSRRNCIALLFAATNATSYSCRDLAPTASRARPPRNFSYRYTDE